MNKMDIIAEIKRTAGENGGNPLGVERFERATGIRPYDWQRYWPRFSDVLRDAGFMPNKMQSAYDDEFLIEKYIELVRELKHVPVRPEIRMKKFSDPEFPNSKVFERFGSKDKLLETVLNYIDSKPGYEDVVEICQAAYTPGKATPLSFEDTPVSYGFVYLIKGHPGEYKIGRTNLVDRRMSELGATASIEHELVHEIKTDDPAGIEAYWHRRFSDKRMKGEWFSLRPDDIKAFKRWRKIL